MVVLLNYFNAAPVKRSNFRLTLGKHFFTLKRYIQWLRHQKKYARTKSEQILPNRVFFHKTPLLRPLREDIMPLQHNKIVNLRLAVPRINGLILRPGEIFSFWKLIGKPSKKRGFTHGLILQNGRCLPGIGGGLCQLSNLIYWLTLHTPLTVQERWRHNYDVFPDAGRTQPFGSGATVVYNYVDLQIQNPTNDDYQLVLWLDNDYLNGAWHSSGKNELTYEVYENEHSIKSHWWGGYTRQNVLKRKITDKEGRLIADQFVCSNEAIMMYEPLLNSSEEGGRRNNHLSSL
jgi:vancomycin resistance protein VanW